MNKKSPSRLKRFFARIVDYVLGFALLTSIIDFTHIQFEELEQLITFAMLPLLWIPVEATLLALFGTTPGKALFGIRVRTDGKKPSFFQSIKRSFIAGFRLQSLIFPLSTLFSKPLKQMWDRPAKTELEVRNNLPSQLIAALIASACILSPIAIDHYSGTISLLATGDEQFMKWKQFKVPEQGTKIEFPDHPSEIEKELEIPKSDQKLLYKEYTFDHPNENIKFSISYTELPRSILKWSSSLVLKGSLQIIVKNLPSGTEVIEKQKSKFLSYPSLEYQLRKGDTLSQGRLLLIDNMLYKLDITYPQESLDEVQPSIANFLDSFKPNG